MHHVKLAWRAKNAGSSKFSSYFHPFWGFVPFNEKKQRDQLAASRFKSENWEGETGSSGRTNFLRSGHVVFFFFCLHEERDRFVVYSAGNFMKFRPDRDFDLLGKEASMKLRLSST